MATPKAGYLIWLTLLAVISSCLAGTRQKRATFEDEFLEAHNAYRARHGSPPLKLDPKLSAFAKDWAQTLAKKGSITHRPNNPNGENIYWASGFTVTGKNPVESWYNEVKDYNFNNPGFTPGTGHFTQVVWKNSKTIGVGVVRKDKETYVVANYSPPGNYLGQFDKNVLPPKN